ncbi:MAG: hypothetical protein K2K75_00945 [Muribaculaceae bacterium]|nr:hypothetical protein [Muribaculaceae bacterium]
MCPVPQHSWHSGVSPEEKEDVALMIASTIFRKEILVMYLNRDPDFKPEENIRDVRAYRQRNGIFAFSITFNESYMTLGIPMDQDDSDRYRRLDPDDKPVFLMHLAVDHLTNQSA